MTPAGTSIKCPGCGAFYSNVGELVGEGGELRSIGLALKATCPRCGRRWAVNQNWRRVRVAKAHIHKGLQG